MNSENNPLSVEILSNGVAIVTYDVPGEAVNTLKASFAGDFEKVLDELQNDSSVKAAVLISGKSDTWVAGADIDMLKNVKTKDDAEQISKMAQQAFLKIANLSKPLVAAIHGSALGGGFELALACHGRILSNDKKTVLALPEVQLGILPAANGLQRLAKKIGLQAALDYGLTGKNMKASKAKQLGVADDVVAPSILKEVAVQFALKLAKFGSPFAQENKKRKMDKTMVMKFALEENPFGRALLFKKAKQTLLKKTGGHYPAPEKILEVLKTFAENGFEASRELEAKYFGELVVSPVAQRLMEIFFATTALKKDNGVDDSSVKALPIRKIAMLGSGLMGAGISYVSANAGYSVRMKDRDDESLGRGLKYVGDILDERVKKKQLTRIEKEEKLSFLSTTTDYSGFKNVDLIIEAVFEDLNVKHKVIQEVEANTKEGIIFASNTSSIPITKIAKGSKHPDRVVGMHYFSPVHKMPLLEVIRTKETAPEVVATAVAVGKKQGKTVIVVNDGVGFYTSRILAPYMNEASYLLTEGCSIQALDKAMTSWGWPVGPITLLDEVGIDIAAHIGPVLLEAFGDRMIPPPTMAKLITDGRKGRKNEKGFYLYGEAAKKKGKGKHIDESVYTTLGLSVPDAKSSKFSAQEIQDRCNLQFINEALHCFGEGVLRSPRDGDMGAIFGLGFPPFLGGPFRYVDSLSPKTVLNKIKRFQEQLGTRWTPAPILEEMVKSGKRFYT